MTYDPQDADAAAGSPDPMIDPTPETPARHFGYLPDPNFTTRFKRTIADDTELSALIEAEKKAIFADTSAGRVMTWAADVLDGVASIADGADKIGPLLARQYAAAGGNLTNARRIFQLVAQAYVQKKLDGVDIPGPDAWIKPKIYELLIKFAGEGFDEAIKQ